MSHKILLLTVCWIFLLFSSSNQLVELHPPQDDKLENPPDYTHKGIIRVGVVRELRVPKPMAGSRPLEFIWLAEKGEIVKRQRNAILFQAPDTSGSLTVSCQVLDRKKVLATHHFVLTAFKQVLVLKADDLVYHASSIFPPQWNSYFALVDSLGIKGSAGIIGQSLESAPQAYYNRIKMFHEQGNIEFWNHGYNHSLHMRNAKGEICHEFYNRDYKDQSSHMNRTQELGRLKLGFTFRAFGAPGNKFDSYTSSIIETNSDIRIWFYGDANSQKSILNRSAYCEIEYPTHKPDFIKFLAHYNPAEEFLTLQFHPSSWNQQQYEDFRKILLYLHQQQVLFMTPSEFAEAFYPQLMAPGISL